MTVPLAVLSLPAVLHLVWSVAESGCSIPFPTPRARLLACSVGRSTGATPCPLWQLLYAGPYIPLLCAVALYRLAHTPPVRPGRHRTIKGRR